MVGEKLSFINLFSKKQYSIEIPKIQRDYAQGRAKKSNIRKQFLKTLKDRLVTDTPIDLDFVYGNVTDLKKFLPLDGQQRLTTLFLLHWYLAHKEGKSEEFNGYLQSEGLSRFTYETRISSKDFCNALVKNGNIFFTRNQNLAELKGTDFSNEIKNSSWFFMSWNSDPTISGMLTMLDSIHEYFFETSNFFEKLSNEEQPKITFQFLNLQDLKMTDDLYIKMNARGKPLTEFENFKARFEKLLDEKHNSFKSEFSIKVDGIWCDLFWSYRNVASGLTVDDLFMNYFSYISEMLFHKNFKDETFDFDTFENIEKTYDNVDNVTFLIQSLDLFAITSKLEISTFFKNIFSNDVEKNKIRLFDGKNNLFEIAITKSTFDAFDKLLLFSIINYLIKANNDKITVSDNLKDYVRICRNYLLKLHQKGNQGTKDIFRLNIFANLFNSIIDVFDSIFNEENVYQKLSSVERKGFNIQGEIFKAKVISDNKEAKSLIHKLEDHNFLKGDLCNFESIINDFTLLQYVAKDFYSIFDIEDNGLIIRSLLSISDYKIYVGDCGFGNLYTFGKGEKWHRVLTDRDGKEKLSKIFSQYFEKVNSLSPLPIEERLNNIVKTGLEESEKNSWIYLFLKYPVITSGSAMFSFNDTKKYEIEKLDGLTLRNPHINSYSFAVLNHQDLNSNAKRVGDWAKDTDIYWIWINHNDYELYMFPEENYWSITNQNDLSFDIISDGLEVKQQENSNKYKLYPSDKLDFVEVAVKLINNIYNK